MLRQVNSFHFDILIVFTQVTGDLGALYNSIVKVIDKMHDLAAVEGNNLQKEWSHFLGKASP